LSGLLPALGGESISCAIWLLRLDAIAVGPLIVLMTVITYRLSENPERLAGLAACLLHRQTNVCKEMVISGQFAQACPCRLRTIQTSIVAESLVRSDGISHAPFESFVLPVQATGAPDIFSAPLFSNRASGESAEVENYGQSVLPAKHRFSTLP
jgi:hypothetical protein